MSNWTEKLNSHPLHDTLDQLLTWVQLDIDSITDDVSEVRRFENVIRRVQHNLKQVDPEFVATNELDAFNSALRNANVWNQVSSFHSNGNAAHIRNANSHLTNALASKYWLVSPMEGGSKVEQEQLREIYDDLASKFQDLKDKFDNLQNEKSELETVIENRRKEVDQQISQWQQQFSDAQEKRSENYQDWKSSLEKDIRDDSKQLKTDTVEELNSLKTEALSALENLKTQSEDKHKKIQELYELASGDSISGGYTKTAKNEEKQANLWRWLSLSFVLATVFWIYSAYDEYRVVPPSEAKVTTAVEKKHILHTDSLKEADGFNWSKYLLTFSLTGVLLFGAGYTAQQSSKHREEARRTRRFALQVKALDPYISSLDFQDQTEIKKKLTEKFFNGVDHTTSLPDTPSVSPKVVSQLVQALTDIAKGK